ncbi:MAG: hypothetical protein MJE77_06230 [Proteobacteria bacterium]|nr:hypothetical protein [Pseudomonadota bacterium]
MKAVLLSVLAAATLTVASPAHAQERHFGIMIDGGLPDGANASLIFRPISNIRLHAGGNYNAISAGFRAGLTVAFDWLVSPSLTVEGGWFLPGDANSLIQRLSGDPEWSMSALEQFRYNYANAHLGLELSTWRLTLYLHAGASMVRTSFNDVSFALEGVSDQSDAQDTSNGFTPTVEFRTAPRLRMFIPSAQIGLVFYL